MSHVLRIALPSPSFFLRYPLITFFNYVASYCGGELKISGSHIELMCSPQDLKNSVEQILQKLLSGELGGYPPYVPLQEARNRLGSLRVGKKGIGLCKDVDTESLIECYLNQVVTKLSPQQYFDELSQSMSVFKNGYVNDSKYGLYSPLSILIPEAMEALRVFGASWSRGTQVYPSYALLRERIRLGFHSLATGLAGLWLGKTYRDPTTGNSTYILLVGERFVKEAVEGHEQLIKYSKARQLSDLALKLLSVFTVTVHGGEAAFVEIIESGNRCDLIRFDTVSMEELLKFVKYFDKEGKDKTRKKIVNAIARGDDYGHEVAYRLFIAATNPRLRHHSIYVLARKILFSETPVLSSSDLSEILKALEALSV